MFSIFKQASDTQDGVLKELTEDQLSEVAGGKWHHMDNDHDRDDRHKHHKHHHHTHHHHMWKTTHPTTTTTTGTTTSMGVTYPAKTHW